MEPQSFELRGDHITLAHALKAVGLTSTGGQAKYVVRQGTVKVNGDVETRPGRKLSIGDRFVADGQEWVLVQEPGE